VETKEDFLRSMEEDPPDLILSDHGLPSFNGFVALNIIQEQYPEVPFIFVTGSNEQALMIEMFESGAAGYVYKNRLSDLVPTVRQAFEQATIPGPRPSPEPSSTAAGKPQPAPAAAGKARRVRLGFCPSCQRVLNDQGVWEKLEVYLRRQEEATVTLALCPTCAPPAGSRPVPLVHRDQ